MLKISKIIQGNFLLVTLALAPDSYGAAGSYDGGLLDDFDKETLTQVSKLVQAAYPDERDSVEK